MTEKINRNVLLYRAQDQIEASLLESMLEESGIPVVLVGGQAAIGFGGLGSDALIVDVRVAEENHEAASALVESYFATARGESSRPELSPWICGQCAETVEGNFQRCWKCDALRPEVAGECSTPIPVQHHSSSQGADRLPGGVILLRCWISFLLLCMYVGLCIPLISWADSLAVEWGARLGGLLALFFAGRWSFGFTDRKLKRGALARIGVDDQAPPG